MTQRMFETLLVHREGQVGRIILNRPDALNACNDKMGRELLEALNSMEKDVDLKCLIITGTGRAFCAGEDVPSFLTVNERYGGIGGLLREKYHPIIEKIHYLNKPVIAGLNGIAAGGGLSLALACDIRIASAEAKIKVAFLGMGLAPDAGSSYFLSRILGYAQAIELVLTNRTVDANEAKSLGLVSSVIEPDKFNERLLDLARLFASMPSKAVAFSKQLLREAALITLSETLENEATLQDIAGQTKDHSEAVTAFLEKRKPKFTGN